MQRARSGRAISSIRFVRGIADGSLEIQKFRFYLLQDYVYLFDYAKVFAQGVVKSRDPEVMRMFASSVANILGGEMNIHRGYMKRLGITEEDAERVKPSLPNSSYTAYMRCRGGRRPGRDHGSGAFLRAQL